MAKNDDRPLESFSAGSRQNKPHGGEDAWQLGGRKDEDYDPARFNAELAASRAHRKDK